MNALNLPANNFNIDAMHTFLYYLYIKVVISVMSVCLSDHNSETPGPICLKFVLGTSVGPQE